GRGYFDAEVDFERKEVSTEEQTIDYAVERGSRYKLVYVEIHGNKYFDALTIRERMNIVPAGQLIHRSGSFSEDLLGRDRSAIEDLYRGNGFKDVLVKTRVEKNYKGKEQDIAVFLDIEEGEQWFVNSLEMSGVDLRLYNDFLAILTSTQGQPYSAFNVATDRDNMLNAYYDNGYPDASMDIVATPAPGKPRMMDVKYTVTEGRRLFVRDVQVT